MGVAADRQTALLSSPAAWMSRLGQLCLSQFALQILINGFFLLLLNGCCYRTARIRNQRPGRVDWGRMQPVSRGSGSLTGPLVLCPSPEQPWALGFVTRSSPDAECCGKAWG